MAMASFFSIHPNSHFNINFNRKKKTITTSLSTLKKPSKMQVPFELKQGQNRIFHQLPSGLNMEVIYQKGILKDSTNVETLRKRRRKNPPLVFIHGSFHAAWCWAVHWLPFFSGFGYDCYAVSLLGQGESDVSSGPAAGTLQTHAMDVANFVEKEINIPPVLIGHSFGGLIVQSYISNMSNTSFSGSNNMHPELAGAILVCSVPPSGNSGLVWRYLFSKPIAAFKVTMSLAAKAFATSLPLCKETFFSNEMEDNLVQRYQELMKDSSRMPLFDLKKLNESLPVSSVPKSFVKILVVGANNDFIVDNEGLNETANFYGVPPVSIEGVAHDMMLDCSWEKGAQVILSWLNDFNKQGSQ
ncbi:hypothetical protein AQUCO_04100010v1 [Aquilegia coerulea]|uniref:AB hydrolase-1 domain-containing protein n=1 Tax=Aquilegia coerulea TaxID=218851 RepID=A0A2G5CPT5_AQUCA|nr:hypothetical protein AQUCO_04100010v1 [Aquilegia coerulea]